MSKLEQRMHELSTSGPVDVANRINGGSAGDAQHSGRVDTDVTPARKVDLG